MVVGTGRLHLTQTSETSFQETTRHRGWYASAVAGRSRRHVEGQRRQRRYGLSPHDDGRLLESGLVCSHEEQVRGVVGGSAAIHVRRRLPPDLADGSRHRIPEQIRSGAIAALRHPLLLHAQRGAVVERFNRTLKSRMWRYFTKHQTWRYIDILPDLMRSYNNTPTA